MISHANQLPHPLVFIDIETSFGDPKIGRVIEIGLIKVFPTGERQTWESFINPEHSICPFVQTLTGIQDADVENAPVFEAVADTLMDFLQDSLFIAHNVKNDFKFLKKEMTLLGRPFEVQALCTLKVSHVLYPNETRHGLEALVHRYDLPPVLHRALSDASYLWLLWQKWLSSVGEARFFKTVTALIHPLPPPVTRRPTPRSRIQRARLTSSPSQNKKKAPS